MPRLRVCQCAWELLVLTLATLLATSCKDDDEDVAAPYVPKATVTLLVTTNGLGDNGYNDMSATAVFSYAKRYAANVSLLRPKTDEQAKELYIKWLDQHAETDSAVLIVGNSYYEDILSEVGDVSSLDGQDEATTGSRRVLLFESFNRSMPKGISSLLINRYGQSYLAGCMCKGMNAPVVVASKGNRLTDDAADAFVKGATEDPDTAYHPIMAIAKGEKGYAMIDSVYKWIALADIIINLLYEHESIFYPLLGGSSIGIVNYLNENETTNSMMIGIDVDQGALTHRIPFSAVTRLDLALVTMLEDWRDGNDWPKFQLYGMRDGMADIVMSKHYVSTDTTGYVNDFGALRSEYYDEALQKEIEYEAEILK